MMSRFRRIDILDRYYSPSLFVNETSFFAPMPLAFPSLFEEEHNLSFALDVLNPLTCFSPLEIYDSVTDLVQIEKMPSFCSYRRVQRRVEPEFSIQTLCDRVTALESNFDRLVSARIGGGDRKYTWMAEIKGPVERKYKWVAEIKDGKKKAEEKEKKYKWSAEIEGKGIDGPISKKYTFTASAGDAGEFSKSEKKENNEKKHHKKDKKGGNDTRIVEIEEPSDHGVVVLRQAFAKRAGVIRNKRGKKKELSPQDAALMIQVTFRAYLIRRSQALRALRELAVAKSKLKEIRAYFNNFSYRRQVAQDAEERQRFSEKIIVLLLTVDAIEGADLMVRAAKKSMVDELEAMLDVVDPQPPGKSLSMRRRTFDMPDGVIQKEIAEGVAQVVEMFESEENATAV
ncbi:BAG family molecular chaperone regulator 7 [Durio zibethinus]|uniref:BAG family molecular chaperone regulator 7 n=1 Tax=Durio zibethinus TaxID=66656 RepID=A0A6P5YC34_DURZI|nr:BAG family molecular chaperone regulator 7 [Durio zibethinus]